MNEDAKEIYEIISRKLDKISKQGDVIISPNYESITIYDSGMKNILLQIIKTSTFGEIGMSDNFHTFKFNLGSDKDSLEMIWNELLNNFKDKLEHD